MNICLFALQNLRLNLHLQHCAARDVINDITSDDFINSNRIRSSRRSAFAASRFDLLLTRLSVTPVGLNKIHPLNTSMSAATTVILRVEMMCPGISKVKYVPSR